MDRTIKTIFVLVFQTVVFYGTVQAEPHTDFYDRPIPMGVSISTTPSAPMIFAGTAGMRVRSLAFPSLKFILSNNHVMGTVAPTLCPDTAPQYTWILQPGTLDIGFDPGEDPTYIVGSLFGTVPIDFTPGARNLVDAAVALTNSSLTRTEILGIGDPTPALGFATPGMPIIKSGRTTGVTTGIVQSINATVLVYYGDDCGFARFVGQAITNAAFGAGGDSGSAVLNRTTHTPVGLYFAGSPFNGIMNQIYWVYTSLGVFVDSDLPVASSDRTSIEQLRVPHVDKRIRALEAVQARHEARIMSIPGVVGVGIGRAEHGKGLALIVYCEKMTAEVKSRVPKGVEGVPVRLIESGRFEAH